MNRICEDESVDAVYPVHDAEILALAGIELILSQSCSVAPKRIFIRLELQRQVDELRGLPECRFADAEDNPWLEPATIRIRRWR